MIKNLSIYSYLNKDHKQKLKDYVYNNVIPDEKAYLIRTWTLIDKITEDINNLNNDLIKLDRYNKECIKMTKTNENNNIKKLYYLKKY